VVLGRTVVLCYSSWCLNIGSYIFHLVVARKTRWQGGARRKHRVFCMQVGACISPVGVGTFRELMLPSSGC
jgi:hypothetical protein